MDTDADSKLRIKSPGKTKMLKASSGVEGMDGCVMSSRGTDISPDSCKMSNLVRRREIPGRA